MTKRFIGTDIVSVERVSALLRSHPQKFKQRVFTSEEIHYCEQKAFPATHYSGRFAAKEALKKALMSTENLPVPTWTDMEILSSKNGAPIVNLKKDYGENCQCQVSISHTEETAIAVALIELDI